MGEIDEFSRYRDMTEAADIIPTYAFRVVFGLDNFGDITLCINQVGTIEGMTLLGVFETLKARLLEA